jgi:putative redox protein
MEVVAEWEGGYRCRISAGQFELRADEPPSAGGDDTGPTPTQLFLASLAACFTMALSYVARKRRATLPPLQVAASGEYDGPRFVRVRVDVRPATEIDGLDELIADALNVCYVSNTLRDPVPIEVALGGQSLASHG